MSDRNSEQEDVSKIELIEEPQLITERCDQLRAQCGRVGVVPTMGALHQGHLSLVEAVRAAGAKSVVVTIFVNPLQFGPNEDYSRYPRTLDDDLTRCRELNVDVVFAPERSALYPDDYQTHIDVSEITKPLEGTFRPGHFQGVTTIVAKLFNLVGPCVAAFGKKDYQQWRVIETMARDLNMPIEVLGCPIVREKDGLAMSSRNRYLSSNDRSRALGIHRGIIAARDAFTHGERDADTLREIARKPVDDVFDKVDYVEIADAATLERCQGALDCDAVILVAAHLGTTRLIDNLVLEQR
jgi:pantoate--beta-alanine ligase